MSSSNVMIDESSIFSSEKDIFFGSTKNLVYLKAVSGSTYKFTPQSITCNQSESSFISALQYRLPLSFLGPQYQNVVVPCIPAHDLQSTPNSEFNINPSSNLSRIPNPREPSINDLQKTCYVKVPSTEPYDFIAFQSGKRSAIVKTIEGMYVRLKGCGNLTTGFPLEKAVTRYPQQCTEPRGCQFFHTAKRELYVSDCLQTILSSDNIECAIRPLGYWRYATKLQTLKHGEENQSNQYLEQETPRENNEVHLKNDAPFLQKYCSLYETLGEKRLSTHLIQGLSMLLRASMKQSDQSNSNSNHYNSLQTLVQRLFPQRCTSSTPNPTEMTPEQPQNTQIEFDDNTMEFIDVVQHGDLFPKDEVVNMKTLIPIEKESLYIDLLDPSNVPNNNQATAATTITTSEPEILIDFNQIFSFLNVNESYKELYERISNRLGELTFSKLFNEMSKIFARIGWEVGRTMRAFYKARFNWGYYSDHDTAFHCNAHPNNFVILPPGIVGNGCLLAPLDFDMAFFAEEFININEKEETFGENDRCLFSNYVELSRQCLELALNGMEIMQNFQFETHKFDQSLSQKYNLYLQTLRDTLRVHYIRGLEQRPSVAQDINLDEESSFYDIIKLSLLLTSDEVA